MRGVDVKTILLLAIMLMVLFVYYINSKNASTVQDVKQHLHVNLNHDLTEQQSSKAVENATSLCLKNAGPLQKKAYSSFFSGKQPTIRHSHHTYLNRDSIVMDIGGNIGQDASELISRYDLQHYFILEPVKKLYDGLVEKFSNNRNIRIFNFGLGIANAEYKVVIKGPTGEATSVFLNVNGEKIPIQIKNATDFLMNVDLPAPEIDLMTINCEGCEFEVLETLLSTGIISSLRHLQFATHATLPGIKNKPFNRYCRIQSLLPRTHRITYQYKFVWETWTRHDLPTPTGPSTSVN